MVKKSLCIALLALTTLSSSAQKKEWFNNVKLSGYGMTQYQYSDQKGNKSNSFNLRLFRLVLDGRILNDFYWKAQIQVNGNTSTLGSSPRLVDLFAEWQKYDYFKVKIGEFKRPFTFDNPLHPIDQGFMGVGQVISKLSGFSDRTGEHPSNGRDLGLQVQGDFLKNAAGRNLLHYQIGVFNGQGINTLVAPTRVRFVLCQNIAMRSVENTNSMIGLCVLNTFIPQDMLLQRRLQIPMRKIQISRIVRLTQL